MINIYFIIATLNERPNQIKRLIYSIDNLNLCTTFRKNIIIANQGLTNFIDIVDTDTNITELSIAVKGAANARNQGVLHIKKDLNDNDIVCFPDDDCWYEEYTINMVLSKLNGVDGIVGSVLDPEQDKYFGYRQSNSSFIFSKWNAHKALLVSMFFKGIIFKNNIKFDKILGVGAEFGCGEETDLLFNILSNNYKIIYSPAVVVYHLNYEMTVKNVKSYSYGQGALIYKMAIEHKAYGAIIFIIARPVLAILFYGITFNMDKVKLYIIRILSLLSGIINYRRALIG